MKSLYRKRLIQLYLTRELVLTLTMNVQHRFLFLHRNSGLRLGLYLHMWGVVLSLPCPACVDVRFRFSQNDGDNLVVYADRTRK